MKLFSRLILAGLLLFVICNIALSYPVSDTETWYKVLLDNHKAGYEWDRIKNTKYRGNDACLFETGGLMSLGTYPLTTSIQGEDHLYLNGQYHPMEQTGTMVFESKNGDTSTKKNITYTVVYEDTRIICEVNDNGKISKKTIRNPKDIELQTYWRIEMGAEGFKLGDVSAVCHVDPTEMKLKKKYLKITKISEPEAGRRRIYETEETDAKGKTKDLSEIYKDKETAAFAKVYKSVPTTREDALSGLGVEGTYLTAGIPVDKKLPVDGQILELTVQLISTSDDKLTWPSDSRQSVTKSDDGKTTEFKVSARPYDEKKSILLPVTDKTFKDYLADAKGVEVKHREIIALARQVVGSETNAYKAACLLRNWIASNIAGYVDHGKKSALKTLREKRGVCTDSAVLFIALARSSGIPAKFVTGLTYGNDGFYNHAWAEVYVGEWIPIDPTLRTDFVDATHIKISESASKDLIDRPSNIDTRHMTVKIIGSVLNADDAVK